MKKELIIRSNSSAVDFALLKDGKLIELNKEVDSNKFSVCDIYAAKIRKPVSGLNAAFINVGHEKDGFLHYHDLGPKFLSLICFNSLFNASELYLYICRIGPNCSSLISSNEFNSIKQGEIIFFSGM